MSHFPAHQFDMESPSTIWTVPEELGQRPEQDMRPSTKQALEGLLDPPRLSPVQLQNKVAAEGRGRGPSTREPLDLLGIGAIGSVTS